MVLLSIRQCSNLEQVLVDLLLVFSKFIDVEIGKDRVRIRPPYIFIASDKLLQVHDGPLHNVIARSLLSNISHHKERLAFIDTAVTFKDCFYHLLVLSHLDVMVDVEVLEGLGVVVGDQNKEAAALLIMIQVVDVVMPIVVEAPVVNILDL